MEGCAKLVECMGSNDIMAGDIAEFEECGKCSDDIRGDEPLNGIQIYLNGVFSMLFTSVPIAATFIRALESSPVHWLKFLPCLNRRKPGNGGARAILLIGR